MTRLPYSLQPDGLYAPANATPHDHAPTSTSTSTSTTLPPGATRVMNYTFDAQARTVTFHGLPLLQLNQVIAIIHVPTGQHLYNLYHAANPARTDSVNGNTLTLAHDTTALSSDDELAIWVDTGQPTQVDIGRITADTSSISVRYPAREYGPYTLLAANDITDPIDGDGFAHVLIDYDFDNSAGDGIQIQGSIDGLTWYPLGGWIGIKGRTTMQLGTARWVRVLRTNTTAKPITINRISLRNTTLSSAAPVSGTLPPVVTVQGMQGLNSLAATLASSRFVMDATTGDNILATGPFVWTGAVMERQRTASVRRNASITATGDTALWTPASGKKFRLMQYLIEVTADAALAAAGTLVITLRDATTSLNLVHRVRLPAAAGTGAGVLYSTGMITVSLNGALSSAANNALNVNLSAALTSGTVNVIALGVEE